MDSELTVRKIDALIYTVSLNKCDFAAQAKYSPSYVLAHFTRRDLQRAGKPTRAAVMMVTKIHLVALESGRLEALRRLTNAPTVTDGELREKILEWLLSPNEFVRSETPFSSRITDALKAVEMRNMQLAQAVGLPQETISRFCKGTRTPKMYTAATEGIYAAIYAYAEETNKVTALMRLAGREYTGTQRDYEESLKWFINII